MEISEFSEVELPNLTVTEANPAHVMDFRRYASDMVVRFNKAQADIIRAHSPGRDVIHNFMGRTLAFDHFAVGADLDISSWDSYPLGFLEDRSDQDDAWKRQFARAGDPDFQAFHHDLYRATSEGPLVGDGTAARAGELGAAQSRAAATAWCGCGAGRPSPTARKR
jgi:beta-galactosidase